MTSTCQLSRNGSSKTLEEPFVKVEILRRDCPSRSPHFNPLRPCGRRRGHFVPAPPLSVISIHSTRVGEDSNSHFEQLRTLQFQSTPPVWAKTGVAVCKRYKQLISIHSTRVGGDRLRGNTPAGIGISIHSARVGGDLHDCHSGINSNAFQSTPPVWAETFEVNAPPTKSLFQSTPPVWAETSVAL